MQPAEQGGLQGLGLEPIEDAFEGVVRGNAVGPLQEALQPIPAFASEGFAVGPGIGAGEDSADGAMVRMSPSRCRLQRLIRGLGDGECAGTDVIEL